MNVRAVALAVPLALGMACMHTQTGAMGGASASAPPAQQPQAAAGPATQDPIMQPGPAVQGHAGDEVVAGRIAEVGADTVSIETQQGGSTRTLQVVPQTAIEVDGQDASVRDLAEGQQVRASFDVVDGQEVAVKIHAGELTTPGSGSTTDQGSWPGAGGGASDGGTGSGTPPRPDAGTGDGASGPPPSR